LVIEDEEETMGLGEHDRQVYDYCKNKIASINDFCTIYLQRIEDAMSKKEYVIAAQSYRRLLAVTERNTQEVQPFMNFLFEPLQTKIIFNSQERMCFQKFNNLQTKLDRWRTQLPQYQHQFDLRGTQPVREKNERKESKRS
jgi:hypothetical protein